MTKDMVPEIQRTNLTSVVLSLKCLGVRDVLNFDYVDPPEERMLLEALKQLYIFEAIDKLVRLARFWGEQLISQYSCVGAVK